MATLRNRQKLAALNEGNHGEHPRSNLAQNTNAPRTQEDYIKQVSEEIEGKVIEKLSQEFSRTESWILGTLSRLDEILLNPLVQGHSGSVSEASHNTSKENQRTNAYVSQSDPHPETRVSQSQTRQNFGPDDTHDSNDSKAHFRIDSHKKLLSCRMQFFINPAEKFPLKIRWIFIQSS